MKLTFFVFISHFLSTSESFSIEDWNPFKVGPGILYQSPLRFISRAPESRIDTEIATSLPEEQKTDLSSQVSHDNWDTNLVNIPPLLRHLCYPNATSFVSVAAQFNSGMFCVMLETVYACSDKPFRSNHYPVVSFIKEFDMRFINVKINFAFRMRTETHFFTPYLVTTFVEQERIRAIPKTMHFNVLKNIESTSAFAFTDRDDKNKWIIVMDNATEPVDGNINYYRHFVEEGEKIIGIVPQKEETDAAFVYLRRDNYVEGYSIVGELFYKFMFSTKRPYNEKSEFLRMLWGHNREFMGCPKPVCLAPVVDTIFRLKDNKTYVFVGKYYWDLATGLSIEKAVFIDAISSAETPFPFLGSDIDASFYDPRPQNDTIYLLKGDYVYSYSRTNLPTFERRIYGNHIKEVFKDIPSDINAAFYYRPNATIYFFREYHYWAYDLDNKNKLNGYPRLVTDFEGMPPNIDAIYSDNFGKYYVFYGVFYAMFTEEEFKIGMKLKFQLSSVDFFGCDPSLYGNYDEYKKRMETEFGPLSAKQVLELTDNEGIVFNDNEKDIVQEKANKKVNTDIEKAESFLTTFARLIAYGPFVTDFSAERKTNRDKVTYYTTYIEN